MIETLINEWQTGKNSRIYFLAWRPVAKPTERPCLIRNGNPREAVLSCLKAEMNSSVVYLSICEGTPRTAFLLSSKQASDITGLNQLFFTCTDYEKIRLLNTTAT